MDDQNKNLLLATALSFLVLIGWMLLFPPEAPNPQQGEEPNLSQDQSKVKAPSTILSTDVSQNSRDNEIHKLEE